MQTAIWSVASFTSAISVFTATTLLPMSEHTLSVSLELNLSLKSLKYEYILRIFYRMKIRGS